MTLDPSQFSRRTLLASLASVSALPALARAPSRSLFPQPRPGSGGVPAAAAAQAQARTTSLVDLIAQSGLSGDTAVVALDAGTGEVVEAHRADLRLPPASTAKATTALYAMQNLGPGYRFTTRVVARGGNISNGTLSGDLILRGGGDPVLQTEDLARMADELIRRGLRRVSGRFIVDAGALPQIEEIDEGQPVQAGYNPAIAGINLNFNRVHFAWDVRGGRANLSLDARSEREIPPVSVIDIRAAQRDLPVYTYRQRNSGERWSVAASALGRSGSRWLPVRRPAAYAGDVFRALLRARGCTLPEPRIENGTRGGQVLAEHRSQPLPSILRGMLRYSTNITAEAVGLAATLQAGGSGRSLSRSAQRMSDWAAQAHRGQGLEFHDHSGLGEDSRVSPMAQARFMLSARRQGILPDLLRDHPMRDANGRRIRNHPVDVQAKTGTLNFVSALTGYAHVGRGREVVFSIVSADMDRRRSLRSSREESPRGTRSWTGRARALQQTLVERWAYAQS